MKNLLLILTLGFVAACAKTKFKAIVFDDACQVQTEETGIRITCPDSNAFIPFPSDGADGQDGESSIISLIDPCGDDPGHPDEVLMIFSDNSVLAWYQNLGFSVLQENTVYVTTDHQKCKFMINNNQIVEL